MNQQQIELVQQTFALVEPNAEDVATLFYERLFALDPALRPLFKGDLREQRAKLMTTFTLVVNSLHESEKILEAVRKLGQRHVGYGVQPAHYTTVAAALLRTLA
jgi:hemoglobin-like flavoprotein